jgi:hypothetical protein
MSNILSFEFEELPLVISNGIEAAKHQMEAVRPPNAAAWNADHRLASQAAE